jgi:hypothetical protein
MPTRSPGATFATFAPTRSTTPAPSWPSTAGQRDRIPLVAHDEVRVADPGGGDLHEDLVGPQVVDLDRLHGERRALPVGDGGLDLHGVLPLLLADRKRRA